MAEQRNMVNDAGGEPSLPSGSERPREREGWLDRLNLGFALGLAALLVMGWQWVETRQRLSTLELDMGRRLAAFEARDQEAERTARRAEEAVREAQARFDGMERKLAESQSHQLALEEMYQALARNRDEWSLAEIEQILLIASQQLQLAGNVKAALVALQTADGRLQRLDKPQFHALRKAIAKDIERLQVLPSIDVEGLSLRLDGLVGEIDRYPLLPGRVAEAPQAPARSGATEGFWQRLGSEVWGDFRQLVRIEDMRKRDLPVLAPEQAYFLRENLKLRLLSARLALFQRNEGVYRADLKHAAEWLARYYDTRDAGVRTAQASLEQLEKSRLSIELPDLSASLGAARAFKLAHEGHAQ